MSAPEHGVRTPLAQAASLIAPGRPLPFRVLDAFGRLLLAQGQVIVDARQLETLLERGACVEREEFEAARREHAVHGGAAPAAAARPLTWFDQWERQVWTLDTLLRTLGRDAGLAPRLQTFIDEFTERALRYPDAALFMCVRQDDKRYSLYALKHALNCATVSLLTAGQLGWDAARTRSLVGAALTMNAAIVDLQGRMAEQAEPPSKAQLEQIRAHPLASAEALRASGVADELWLQAVEQHHERAGGAGYPRRHANPDETAQLLRAADVFTAKISPRQLRQALLPQVAARQLFQEEGGGPLATALIKAVGVHPPGDFVQLKNGETAIVVRRSANASAPEVAVLLNAQGRPVPGAPHRDTAVAATAIAGAPPESLRLPRVLPETFYGVLT